MDREYGKYHIKFTSDPMSWMSLPMSERCFIDGGSVMFYDSDDVLIYAYGAGQWIEVIHDNVFEKMYPPLPL